MKIWGWERWLLETNGHMFFKLNSNISLNQTVPGKCFDLRVFNAEGKILKALQPADQPSSVAESHDHLREYRLPIILYTVLTVLLCLSCFCLLWDWIHVPHIIHCNGVCARCAKYSLSNTFANYALVVSVLVHLWNEAWVYGALAVLSQVQRRVPIDILTFFLDLPMTSQVQTTVKIMSPAVYRLLCW